MNRETKVMNPPATLLASIRFLGPGLILSAAVVGSGELVATTALGADAGFVLLWVILLACLFKVALQVEYGRYCILHNRSSFEAWNESGVGRIFGLHWSVLVAFLFLLSMCIGQGGVIGGAAEVAHHEISALSLPLWILILAVGIALLIFHGRYKPVEWISILFNAAFLFMIVLSVFLLQRTAYAFDLSDVVSGLSFQLPPEGAYVAASVFGIVGIGAGEVVIYPYWCLEKGYAAWCGPNDGSEEWVARAKGWIRVMGFDAVVSMIVYTFSTCAFYFLGAAILPAQEAVAEGNAFIFQLSSLFTEVLGPGFRSIFMMGAFVVLFSTAFANTAGFARMWADFLGIARLVDTQNDQKRRLTLGILAWLLPISWGITYFFMQEAVWMILFMGVVNTGFLVVVAYKALVFRYRFTERRLKPAWWYDIALWLAFFTIIFVGLRTFYVKVIAGFLL